MDKRLLDDLMQRELGVLDKYRVLETLLADVRKQRGIGLSEEEDVILDEMDWIWQNTTDAERKAIEVNEGATAEQAEKLKAYNEWLKTKGVKYVGYWVALVYVDGEVRLMAVGLDVGWVLREAWRLVRRPFVHYVQTPEEREADKDAT